MPSRQLVPRILPAVLALLFWTSPSRGDDPPAKADGLVPFRVYQRDGEDRADIPIPEGASEASIVDREGRPVPGAEFEGGRLVGVAAGGPYRIEFVREEGRDAKGRESIEPVFVGDLWVLAGQSNMEGYGDLVDVAGPHPLVMALGMDGRWARAEEPLHWLIDSPDPVHWPKPDMTEEERKAASEGFHAGRKKGSGLGLAFAATMAEATKIPVGLVPVAHGGTSMLQWDPAKKGEGGKSLYGSMIRQVELAGGKVKGVLWYQGESDANPEASKVYPRVFADFIAALRTDLGQPELPFYFVQIGRFVRAGDPADWNAIQEAQRKIPGQVAHTAVVPSIDLELDDPIHAGTQGLKRLGRRLAWVALNDLFDYPIGTPIDLDAVSRGEGNTIRVKFKGVDLGGTRPKEVVGQAGQGPSSDPIVGLQPLRHIAGFSIVGSDGAELPLIFDAVVDPESRDTVVLQLTGPPPAGASLWYGHGFDPYCNLTDGLDMAAPVFGPVKLDEVK